MALPMDSIRSGHVLLVSAGVGLGFRAWLSRGALLTLQRKGEGLEHLFISAGVGSLVVMLLLGLAALYLVHLIITRAAARHGATNPATFSLQDVAWTHGHRHRDPKVLEIKAERLTWNDRIFNVYPDRK